MVQQMTAPKQAPVLRTFVPEPQAQDALDARRKAERYTGAAFDYICRQWQVWHRGELIGWRDHRADAVAAVREVC